MRRSGLNLAVLVLALAGSATHAQPPAVAPIVVGSPKPQARPQPPADPGVRPASFRAASDPPQPTPAPQPAATRPAPAPQLFLEKIGPASQNAGKPLRYEIVVHNPGAVTLASVRVQEELPPGTVCLGTEPPAEVQGQRLVWALTDLAAGAVRRLVVQVRPGNEGEFKSVATATFQAASTWEMKLTRPKLVLTMTGPEQVQVGDPVPFQRVSNSGNGPATKTVVHVHLPPGLRHTEGTEIEGDAGTLAPGESKTITLTTTAVAPDSRSPRGSATADEAPEATARATVAVTQAALQVRIAGTERCVVHREADYRLEVTNPGQAPATAVVLSDVLPPGLDFVSASDGGAYQAATRTVEWPVGMLAAGQARTVAVKLTGRSAGEWVNQAAARADRGLESTAGAKVTVDGIPALMLEVVDLDNPVEVGAETVYEIRVINQGSSPCTGLRIDAVLPRGAMDLVGAEGPTAHHVTGQQVSFEPLPKLAARADALYRVKVRGVLKGDWRFTAQMTCDQLQRPVTEQESTQVYGDANEGLSSPAPVPAPAPLPGQPDK